MHILNYVYEVILVTFLILYTFFSIFTSAQYFVSIGGWARAKRVISIHWLM